jgi:hypothetical protein
MRLRNSAALAVVFLLSVGVAAAGAAKPPPSASQQLCQNDSGTYSTKAGSSFFAPVFTRKVLWTCNGYPGGSAVSQALGQACGADGGQPQTLDSGFATCWKSGAH